MIEDLERTLSDVGYEPDLLPLEELRRRLSSDDYGSLVFGGGEIPDRVAEDSPVWVRIRFRSSD